MPPAEERDGFHLRTIRRWYLSGKIKVFSRADVGTLLLHIDLLAARLAEAETKGRIPHEGPVS